MKKVMALEGNSIPRVRNEDEEEPASGRKFPAISIPGLGRRPQYLVSSGGMTHRFPRALAVFVSVFLCAPQIFSAAGSPRVPGTAPRASIKLLTIGNSFADNATALLPGFAEAGGKGLLIFRANLGGHSLQQHVGYLKAFEADPNDPKGHAYKKHADPRSGEIKDFSLREALGSEDWDVVTIQQVSGLSFKPESFQPFAGILIDYIHKYAPHAEILIFETWAYPDDYFSKFKEEGLDQQKMYAGLKAAYEKLSADTGLRIIPVGDAFQKVRALSPPISLNVAGDKHANPPGKYLGAAVFYEAIFHDSVEPIPFVPPGISAVDAKALRQAAHETAAESARIRAKQQ